MGARRFRVAFSFAGEKRDFVAQVAEILAQRFGEAGILYDKFHEAEFARRDLGIYLPELYHKQSDLIVAVICADYRNKEWCGLEWIAIHALLKNRHDSRVMLARFDHAEVGGIYDTAGFVELDHKTPDQAATLILERLALNEGQPKDHYSRLASTFHGSTRKLVYISYSHKDKAWHRKLRRVLDADPDLRERVWDDTRIQPGKPFGTEIADHLALARVVVMLCSEEFLEPSSGASRFETSPALAAHASGEIEILWLPIKAHDYGSSPVGHIMAATGAGAIPLDNLSPSSQKVALQRVRQEVRRCLGLPQVPERASRTASAVGRSTKPKTARSRPTTTNLAKSNPPLSGDKLSPALKRWLEKLEFLEEQLAVSSSPAQKFELKTQIEEAKSKITELGGATTG